MGYDLTYDGNDFEKTECIFQTVPTVDGGFCQLPFVLNGNLKTSCILHGNSYKCAVPGKENNKGEYEDYTMKTCLRKYPRIRTLHRNHSLGKVCHFPFIHENEEYTDRCAPMFRDAVGTRIYPNGMPCKRLRTDVSYEGEKFDVWPTWCYTDKAMKTWGECKDKTLKFEDIWCSYCENGLCVEKDNKVTCLCYGGWVGRYCEDVDRCFSDKESKDEYDGYCSNKGICDPAMLDEARCTCKIGYSGDTCEKFDPCSLNLCNIDNTKKCTRNKNDFICVCKPGFTSKLCLVNKACFNNPCENGGTCSTYRDIVSSTPATGTTDTPIIDYLDADSQQIEFEKCTCTKDYVGFFCEEVVACPSDKSKGKCKNGAICLSDDYGNPKCNCTFGYRGIFCEKVNLCNPSNCKNDGICKLVADSYECLCPDSFEGVNCEIPTDKCYQVTCKNFGVCNWDASRKVGFKCECTPGFYGEFCNDRKSICQHEPCLNGGACRDLDIRRKLGNEFVFFVCKCFKRHNGVYCEVPPEEKTIIRHTDTAWKSFVKSMYIAGQVAIPIYLLAYVYLVVKERDNRRYAAARSRSLNIPKVARPSTNICVVLVHVIAVMFCCETVYRSEHMDPPQHHPTPEEQDYKKTKLEIQQKKKKKNRGKVEGFVTQEQRIKEYDEGVLEDKRLMRQIRAKHRSKTRNEQISKEKKESEAWIQNQQNKNKSKNNPDNYNMNQFTDESLSLIKYEIV